MTQATGIRTYFGYIAEVTPGTTPATPSLVAVPRVSDTLQVTRGLIKDAALRSDRMPRYLRLGNKAVGGNVNVSYAPNTFGPLLEAAFRSAYASNVLKIGTTDKSITCEVGHPDISQYRQFTGVRVNKFTLNVPSTNTLVTAELELLGENGIISATTLDAGGGIDDATAAQPFVHLDATFTEGGSSIGYLTGVQVVIENNLQANYAAGSAAARSVTAGMAMVTGQVTAYFESAALFTKWYSETASSLAFTLNSGASSEAWNFPNVKYTALTLPTAGDGPIIQTLSFEALYDAGTSSLVTVTRVV